MGDGEERVCYQLLRAWRVGRCGEGRASAGGEGVGCRREGLDAYGGWVGVDERILFASLGNNGDTNRSIECSIAVWEFANEYGNGDGGLRRHSYGEGGGGAGQ